MLCTSCRADFPSLSNCRESEDSSIESLQSHQAGGGREQVPTHTCRLHALTWVSQVCYRASAVQSVPSEGCGPTPPEVRANQLAATVDNYRRQAIANGLPFR